MTVLYTYLKKAADYECRVFSRKLSQPKLAKKNHTSKSKY